MKVENKEGGQSAANNSPNRKTNSRNKLTSNQTGGDETPSGSKRQSKNNFEGGLDDDRERLGRTPKGEDPGPDDPRKGNTEREVLNNPVIPPPSRRLGDDVFYITIKVFLNNDGTCKSVSWLSSKPILYDQEYKDKVKEAVKRTIKCSARKPGQQDFVILENIKLKAQ
ncbi:MAG: hypothetical protein FJZ66_02800 [Bacteroidetes bacterium]|nr:hypothetical protein [Bacteroidota bacterium]